MAIKLKGGGGLGFNGLVIKRSTFFVAFKKKYTTKKPYRKPRTIYIFYVLPPFKMFLYIVCM